MTYLAQTRYEALNRHVVWSVAEHACNRLTCHETADKVRVASIAATHLVVSQQQYIAMLGNRRPPGRLEVVGDRRINRQRHIDLDRVKTGKVQFKANVD